MLKLSDYCIIVQARLTSKRFPNKIFMKVKNNLYVIDLIIKKLNLIKNVKTIYAIPNNIKNVKLEKYLKKKGCKVFKGSENNVLNRYYNASCKINCKKIIRITSDCPFIDIHFVKKLISIDRVKNFDYCSNNHPRTFPLGLDFEIFKKKKLFIANKCAKKNYDKEHVTPYIQRNAKKIFTLKSKINYSNIRVTLDYKSDLRKIKKIFNYYNFKENINLNDIVNYHRKN